LAPSQRGAILLNKEQAFLLYATFCGDPVRTAAALGVQAFDVIHCAESEDWNGRLKPILDLKKSTAPGDIERGVNRALNFVQGHRLRMLLERVLKDMLDCTDEELRGHLVDLGQAQLREFSKQEQPPTHVKAKLTTKAFADLATAIEKAHALTYMALVDTATDRAKRKSGPDDADTGADLHAKLAKAMSQLRDTPAGNAFDAKLGEAQGTVAAVLAPRARFE